MIETQIEAGMKVKGSFNENHWLFGKFAEAVAEGIDLNREEINKLKDQVENLTKSARNEISRKKRK